MATTSKTRKPAAPSRKPVARKAPVRKPAGRKSSVRKLTGREAPVRKPAVRKAPAAKATASRAVVLSAAKPKKPKLVRDNFTIPKTEFRVLQELKQRAGKAGAAVKKSEILRAGIKALAAMNDAALATALAAVPAIKTGRPPKD